MVEGIRGSRGGVSTEHATLTLSEDPKPDKLNELTELVYETDPYGKALTGRTPERIEEETGIPQDEMFPQDADILYVGDPWQRMGKELDESHGSRLTLIDYEFGEVASFETNDESFRHRIEWKGEHTQNTLENLLAEGAEIYTDKDIVWMQAFKELLQEANDLSQNAKTDADYYNASEAWTRAREFIEVTHKAQLEEQEQQQKEPGDPDQPYDSPEQEDIASFRTDAWYTCVDGERGFKDIPDWKNIIKPKVDAKEKELAHLPEEERERQIADWTRTWIEEIRLQKKTEKANVVEAVFPQLPFKNESFDRFVASWSISAHTFSQMDTEGFNTYWDEIRRVLKPGGSAYIFPLNFYWEPDQQFIDSLKQLETRYPDMSYEIRDTVGHLSQIDNEQDVYGDEFTLILHKN